MESRIKKMIPRLWCEMQPYFAQDFSFRFFALSSLLLSHSLYRDGIALENAWERVCHTCKAVIKKKSEVKSWIEDCWGLVYQVRRSFTRLVGIYSQCVWVCVFVCESRLRINLVSTIQTLPYWMPCKFKYNTHLDGDLLKDLELNIQWADHLSLL